MELQSYPRTPVDIQNIGLHFVSRLLKQTVGVERSYAMSHVKYFVSRETTSTAVELSRELNHRAVILHSLINNFLQV